MQLVGYQVRYLESLYRELVDYATPLILFTGPKGCGKSVILEEMTDSLKENWKVFLIVGTGEESPPYYTWYSASHKSPKQSRTRISEISFGVSFQPIGLPIGFEANFGFESGSIIFNGNEQAILKAIGREVQDKDNILLIAEDYASWDMASKDLLMKISSVNGDVFGSNKSIHMVLVDAHVEYNSAASRGNTHAKICIEDIDLNDIEAIISQQPYIKALSVHDLEQIIQFTGYDLRLINLAVRYQQEGSRPAKISSLSELLETRISQMPAEHKSICHTLEHVSIINSLFSEKEAAHLLDQEPIMAEKALDEAADLKLIRKRHAYDFPIPEIRKYFENKLTTEKKYLHYRFAQYLREHYPEDYLNRAHHLCLSEQANSETNILEAVYLIVIEMERRKELTGGAPELILENRLNEMMTLLPSTVDHIVKTNIKTFYEGYHQLNLCRYAEAIIQFDSLHLMYAPKSFSVESKRLQLLSHVQLADDLQKIKHLGDILYDCIMEPDFCEDELWCRTALLLLEVYGDRHVRIDRFQRIKSGFETRIRNHMYQSAFQSLHAKYACKAALFYNSQISVKLTEESCDYYRTYSSVPNLYYALCNNAANRIVCGDYDKAALRLKECQDIIKENPGIHFPSTYKVKNNIIINTFLKSEGMLLDYVSRKREIIIPAAAAAADALNKLRGSQGYEVSHVIEFNLLSMSILSGEASQADDILRKFKFEYRHLDAYYRYYYHNAEVAQNILKGNYSDALEHLEKLEDQEVILLAGFYKLLNRRNKLFYEIIHDKFAGDAFDLNYEFIKRGIRVQDSSSSYWGRVFILSDLQFLSL